MTAEENAAIVRRLYAEVSNGNLDVLDEVVSPAADLRPPDGSRGVESAKRLLAAYRSAFPDIRYTIEDLIAVDEKVVVRFSFDATHKGEFRIPRSGLAFSPTGKRVTFSGIAIWRFSGGKIVERWFEEDRLGFIQQLGARVGPTQGGAA